MANRGELEVGLCRLRKLAYGLRGCEDCPIACPVQSENLNRMKNVETNMVEVADQLGL